MFLGSPLLPQSLLDLAMGEPALWRRPATQIRETCCQLRCSQHISHFLFWAVACSYSCILVLLLRLVALWSCVSQGLLTVCASAAGRAGVPVRWSCLYPDLASSYLGMLTSPAVAAEMFSEASSSICC